MLKINTSLLLLISLALISTGIQAQGFNPATDTIRWTTTTYSDSLLNVSGESSSVFITYGNHEVKWIPQTGDESNLVFTVQQLTGSWPDGTAVYTLVRNGLIRKLSLANSGSSATLVIRWVDTGGKKRKLEYTIAGTEKL